MTQPDARLPRILIVDDDEDVRSSIRWLLKDVPSLISEASDGNRAIAHLEVEDADLVVLDLLMPIKDGIETLGEIRKRWPAVKVISISGGGYYCDPRVNLQASLQLGAVCALEKPFSAETLVGAVEAALQKAR